MGAGASGTTWPGTASGMRRDLQHMLGGDEGLVLETRQHPWVLVRDAGALVLAAVLLVGVIWYARRVEWLDNDFGGGLQIGIGVVLAVVAAFALWRVVRWWTERLYVTTSKVVYASGVLNRDVTSTPLVKIDEVVLRRPLLGRMFGFGRLEVENAAGGVEPLAGLEYLPRPVELYRTITERARHQRMIEGGALDRNADGLVDPAAPADGDPATPDASSASDPRRGGDFRSDPHPGE